MSVIGSFFLGGGEIHNFSFRKIGEGLTFIWKN